MPFDYFSLSHFLLPTAAARFFFLLDPTSLSNRRFKNHPQEKPKDMTTSTIRSRSDDKNTCILQSCSFPHFTSDPCLYSRLASATKNASLNLHFETMSRSELLQEQPKPQVYTVEIDWAIYRPILFASVSVLPHPLRKKCSQKYDHIHNPKKFSPLTYNTPAPTRIDAIRLFFAISFSASHCCRPIFFPFRPHLTF